MKNERLSGEELEKVSGGDDFFTHTCAMVVTQTCKMYSQPIEDSCYYMHDLQRMDNVGCYLYGANNWVKIKVDATGEIGFVKELYLMDRDRL